MNTLKISIYFTILLSFNLACGPANGENDFAQTDKKTNGDSLDETTEKRLSFTSGIRCIYQDSKGNYWFGSDNEGTAVFNGESFRYYTVKEGLSNNQVRRIQEDQQGTIWFDTANGVCSFDGEKITHKSEGVALDLQEKWRKSKNDLWFSAGFHQGMYRYDGQKLSYLAFPISEANFGKNNFQSTAHSEDSNFTIWFATYGSVFGFNGKTFKTIDNESLKLKNPTITLHVRSILADSKGRLWIGNNGIGVLLQDGDSTVHFSAKMGLIHTNSSGSGDSSPAGTLEHVFAIAEDSKQNIWFGDRDTGAWKYDGKTMTNYAIDETLESQMIWAIYEDQNQNLLFAMANGGVYLFNEASFERIF